MKFFFFQENYGKYKQHNNTSAIFQQQISFFQIVITIGCAFLV